MFYTIGAIVKFVAEWKAEKEAKAVQLVASNPELLRQAIEQAQAKEREPIGAK